MGTDELNVLYLDNHIIAVVKPPGILSQADINNGPDMLTLVKNYIKKKFNKPGDVYMGLVHRLDRQVGGVMVFARTSKAASRLSESIRKREFKKEYFAAVYGKVPAQKIRLTDYLYKNRKENIVNIAAKEKKGAKKAVLEYEKKAYINNYSIIKINLLTGRPHQIRVQMSNAGYPLLGDVKYGGRKEPGLAGPALWAHMLEFKHPVKDKIITILQEPLSCPWYNK